MSFHLELQDIPALNAALNGLATVLITVGFILIKLGKKEAHRRVMTAACVVSAVFLIGYVAHKIGVRAVHTKFGGEGAALRSVYFAMLVTHIMLAIAIAWMVPRTFYLAAKGQIERHRAWAKWTFPIWYYVSVTGVLIYFFLYVWWPKTT
jgi:putative membrane protein